MKHKSLSVAVTIMVVALAALAVAQEKPWYDEKCEFCKPWMTPEMTKNVTWDQREISNGVMTICLFPESLREAYNKASAQMGILSQKAAAGEKIHMCGSCEAMGSFFMRGAKMEEVPTASGVVQLLTASDSTMIAEIHKWAKRDAEEMKKMTEAARKK